MVTNHQPYREKISQMVSWGHWFVLFNILLCLILGSRYLFIADWPASLPGRIYAFVSWLGHFSFIVFIIYLLVIFPLTFVIMSQRLLRFLATLIATTGIILLLVDTEIFTRFYLHLNPLLWKLVMNPEHNEQARDWQLIFICIPVVFLVELLCGIWFWKKLRMLNRYRLGKPLAALFMSSFFATHLIYVWADAHFYRPITMQRANLPLSYPMTARSFLEKHGLLDRQEYQHKLALQGNPSVPSVEYPLSKIAFSVVPEPLNLLMIVINGIDNQNSMHDMPVLTDFARANIQFNNHFSSGSRQDTGLFGLFYGISSIYLDAILATRQPSELMNTLGMQGYQFGLFSSDGFDTPLYRQALLTDFSLPVPVKQQNNQTTQQWQQWLANHNSSKPWFSYISLYANQTEAISEKTNNRAQSVDDEIAIILDTIAKKDIANTTVIVITAVHNDKTQTSYPKLQAPLIMRWPGIPAQQHNKLTSHEDIMATLMQKLLHVTSSSGDYSQGEDLFATTRHHNWIATGENNRLIITTPARILIVDNNGKWQVIDHKGNNIKNEQPQLSLLFQVLTDIRRFIAN